MIVQVDAIVVTASILILVSTNLLTSLEIEMFKRREDKGRDYMYRGPGLKTSGRRFRQLPLFHPFFKLLFFLLSCCGTIFRVRLF